MRVSAQSISFGTGPYNRFDRKVIGWAFSGDMEAVHTTVPATEMAFACAESFFKTLKRELETLGGKH
ncbi:MAG: hypothetical protein LBB83_00270 [Treponema sp.]|nr:hypothetical protein [Treponema sp.]